MLFFKAIVAPAAIIAISVFCSFCGAINLFYVSECCVARLYERSGQAHVMCDHDDTTFSDFLFKNFLRCLQYFAGGVAVYIGVVQRWEGEQYFEQ